MLGVSRNASEEEIKKAYRALVKKYHPDQYKGTDYEATANEKLKQINEAYDIIKNGGSTANSSYYNQNNAGNGYNAYNAYNAYGNNGYYSQGGYTAEQFFQQVRQLLASGRYMEADLLLRTTNIRNAEWYFLMGNVQWSKGWQLEAKKYYAQACRLDPTNTEYQTAYNSVNANAYSTGGGYRDPRFRNARSDDDICNCCCKLWALDTLCECMGGDCIPCL